MNQPEWKDIPDRDGVWVKCVMQYHRPRGVSVEDGTPRYADVEAFIVNGNSRSLSPDDMKQMLTICSKPGTKWMRLPDKPWSGPS